MAKYIEVRELEAGTEGLIIKAKYCFLQRIQGSEAAEGGRGERNSRQRKEGDERKGWRQHTGQKIIFIFATEAI